MLYAVMSAVVQLRDLQAHVKRYEHNEDQRAVSIHALCVLDTELFGSSGMSTRMKHINSRTFPGKQDPSSFFADMRTRWVRFLRMYRNDRMSSMAMSSLAVCALRDNPMNNTFCQIIH